MNLKTRRRALIAQLGGKCNSCGTNRGLQFDHRKPRRWEPSKLSRSKRLAIYERAARAGKLQLLCADCHVAKSAREGKGYDPVKHFFRWLDGKTDKPF